MALVIRLWPLWLLVGCIEERAPITVPIDFVGADAQVTVDGGRLVLDRAVLTASNVRFESAPELTWSPLPWFGSTAWAHPGHDFTGSLRAELLGTWELDLLGDLQPLGIAEGYEGDLATARFDAGFLELSGRFQPTEGVPLPVELSLEIDRSLIGIHAGLDLDVDTPLPGILWSVDLQEAARHISFSDTTGDGRITTDDVDLESTARFGISSIDSWTFKESP